ncbi:MAG: CDP-alcohol phosphatidyltransferase family protein [Actinomycetota bacterium]|nr:CDP-alcohol phosphatidyltransferase family protein [Actinomycetota bacterium]
MSVAEGGESGASGAAPAPLNAAPDPRVDLARGGGLAASTPPPASSGEPTLAVSGTPAPASSDGPTRAQVRTGFGPTALATPANAVTVARLAVAPVVVVMVAVSGATWAAFILAFVVGVTDGLDGWLARRQGPTRSGAFIDPLADKVVVVGLLAAVAARGEVTWVPVLVIGVRELTMSVYRSVAGRHGVSVPARPLAKAKTLVQGVATGLCVLPPVASHHEVLDVAVWVAAALTVVSGVQYLLDGRRAAALGSVS